MSGRALILHPELSLLPYLPPRPQIINEHHAMRLGAAYDDGAYMVLQRLALKLAGDRFTAVHHAISRAPSYAELRDFLIYENDVAPVLAARVALRLTTLGAGGDRMTAIASIALTPAERVRELEADLRSALALVRAREEEIRELQEDLRERLQLLAGFQLEEVHLDDWSEKADLEKPYRVTANYCRTYGPFARAEWPQVCDLIRRLRSTAGADTPIPLTSTNDTKRAVPDSTGSTGA
jgi:hypothetical protein